MGTTVLAWRSRAMALLLGSAALAGCDSPADVQMRPQFASVEAKTGTGQLPDLVATARQATARFHAPEQASRAGYAVASPCVAAPGLGGMGFHWLNEGLVDASFDPARPEAVLYAPGPKGQLQLVAVEYIVIDAGQSAPTFGDQPFDVGGTPLPIPHWSLHVWAHKDNPNGVFTPFNPSVTCP